METEFAKQDSVIAKTAISEVVVKLKVVKTLVQVMEIV